MYNPLCYLLQKTEKFLYFESNIFWKKCKGTTLPFLQNFHLFYSTGNIITTKK
nr:MAG TPA: hypothetical protein [Caudoviricetes sp.]